jgi:hypothetical protein
MVNRTTVLPRLRTKDVIVRELQDEILIYDLATNNALCLNPAGRLVADHCDGVTTLGEVADKFGTGANAESAEVVVLAVLSRLRKEGLLEGSIDLPDEADLPTRRRVLSAAASVGAALPMISLLVVPSAMAQQSGCIGSQQSCASVEDTSCCSGLICVNIEAGPTGHVCIGCLQAGSPCTIGAGTCCAGLLCQLEEGVPICIPQFP